MMDSFHCTVMIQDLLHQVLPPAHRNEGGGSSPLLFTSSGEWKEPVPGHVPTFSLCLHGQGNKGSSTSLRKGQCQSESSRNRETRNKETRNKAFAWDIGIPARLNLFDQEQDKVREIRKQTFSLLHSLWLIYQTLRINSILWCFNTFSVSTPWMM